MKFLALAYFQSNPYVHADMFPKLGLPRKPLISFAHFENLPVLSMLIIDLDNWMILADVDVFS